MADNVSQWVRFELSGLANFGPICSKLERSGAEVMTVAVALSATVGDPCGRSIVLFRRVVTPIKPKMSSAMMDEDGV